MTTYGHIVWPRGKVAITDEDVLWLARSLGGETDRSEAGRAAAAWAMAQRMVWARDQGNRTTAGMRCAQAPGGRGIRELEPVRRQLDFTAMIRCFSSPVNPYHTDRVPERQARRRFWISATPAQIEQRSPGAVDFARRFARGQVSNPVPGAADFDAPDEVPAGAVALYRVGGNVFMGEPGFPRDPNYVRIVPASAVDTSLVVPLVVGGGALLAGAALLWWLHRREQRQARNRWTNRRRRKSTRRSASSALFANAA